jgi:hypothetical protein
MDEVLHYERLDGRSKRCARRDLDDLPDGTMISISGAAFAVRGDALLYWTSDGYDKRLPRLHELMVDVLTPFSIIEVLKAGYQPAWHPSAD